MIHSELCSACSGPLQLGVGLVLYRFKIIFYKSSSKTKFYSECLASRLRHSVRGLSTVVTTIVRPTRIVLRVSLDMWRPVVHSSKSLFRNLT